MSFANPGCLRRIRIISCCRSGPWFIQHRRSIFTFNFSFLVNLRIPATSSHLSNLPCSMLYNQLVAQWDEDKLEAIPAYRTIRKDLKKKYFMLLRSLMYTNQYLWLPKAHKTDCFYLVLNNNFSILFMKTLNLADFFWGFLKAEKRTGMVLFVISI